ncbi:hypothetical protein N7462_006803 [Penicillium macrosclerotiorum]|uniref:uncharacterized protein n=1 Tax=Penicillium macrosclerotiorum TaxID=303699 RepID=UPI002546DDB5|nr:uncharacterized protein N7462_006803 [Penicillium macrosclerotiorum]KAJ5683638.1 hypothetical protein N7462_006803 [Penicillium macrosclerotiorum]
MGKVPEFRPGGLAARSKKLETLPSPVTSVTLRLPAAVHVAQAIRIQIFSSFIQRYYTSEASPSSTCFDKVLVCQIGNLPQKSSMTDRAVLAISCLFLGKTNNDTLVLNHGLYLYNTVIRQMTNMIHRGAYSNELLYIAMIFCEINVQFFDLVFYAPNGVSPLGTHIAGMTSLLKQYKPRAQRDPIVDIIYHHQQKLYLALTSTGMYLSKSEYEYLMEPTNGDPLLEIVQTTATIGSLKSAIEVNQTDLAACQSILQQCLEVQAKLMKLQTEGYLGKEPSQWHSPEYINISSPESLFGPAYQFSTLHNAILYTLFWAHMVILLPVIHRARSLIRSHTSSSSRKNPASQFEDPEYVLRGAYADKIPRAMPYCFQKMMNLSCAKIAFFPLNMASVHFIDTGNRRKLDYCHDVLKSIEFRGIELASYIREVTIHRWERRWDAADPLDCISLRRTDRPFCNTHPASLSQTLSKAAEKGVEDAYLYYAAEETLLQTG